MKSDIPIEPEALSIEQACAFTGLGFGSHGTDDVPAAEQA